MMLKEITQYIKSKIDHFSLDDSLILNNKIIPLDKNNFQKINHSNEEKTITYIDGGQAELLSTGNFSLSLIRVAAVTLNGEEKINRIIKEFYLLVTSSWKNGDIFYEGKIFSENFNILIHEEDLIISSNDSSIKSGNERAPISKVVNMARRFAELSLVNETAAGYFVLDGTLQPTFRNEEKYLAELGNTVCSIAKTSSLFTIHGNNPVVLLNKVGPENCWYYYVNDKTSFVKLNKFSKHVFRFEGNNKILPSLLGNCNDALFIGYPYGLILADKYARVTNEEKNSLKIKLLLDSKNKEIINFLYSSNAHDILDNLS